MSLIVENSIKKNNDLLIGNAILVGTLIGGACLVWFTGATSAISRVIYLFIDTPAIVPIIGIALLSSFFLTHKPAHEWRQAARCWSHVKPWHVALVILVALLVGVGPIYHDYTLSMDEFMTWLQSQIFLAGRLAGQVPEPWRPIGRALFHDFASFDPETGRLVSSYKPGMALTYAAFDLVGLGRFASAVLTAGSVGLVASLARKLWPDSEEAPLVASVILATSQQALIMGLTAYAMPAHLFFNLLWLRLFLSDSTRGHLFAPVVGVWSAALHQVHAHLFFAAPFLLTLLKPLRLRLVLYYGAVYVAGHLAILEWGDLALGGAPRLAGAESVRTALPAMLAHLFRVPGAYEAGTILALIARFFAWQNLALMALLIIAARRGVLSTPLRLMAASIATTLVPYVFLMPDQGHGWGYRYLHGVIGNFALIATAGWLAIDDMGAEARSRTRGAVMLATALTVLVMLPLRAWQVEDVVGRFARASEFIAATDADVVVVDTPSLFYGQDLVRNNPFVTNRPVVVNIRDIDMAEVDALCRRYAVAVYGADDLERFGMVPLDRPLNPPAGRSEMLDRLKTSACRSPPAAG